MSRRLNVLRDRGPGRPDEPALSLFAARAALAWERLWPALWPAAGVAGLFVALAWLDIPARLPGWLHLLVLLGFLAAIVAVLVVGLRTVRLPTVEEARRRIERDSGLPHRPLATLRDRQAGGGDDPFAAALWRAAQDRARRQAKDLKVNAPHPNLAARDPWAVRAVVVLLLAVGGTVAWGDWGQRLGNALVPRLALGGIAGPVALDVWVTPPDYTGQPPIFLTRQPLANPVTGAAQTAPASGPAEPAPAPRAVPVPAGSTLLAKVTGGYGTPKLVANDGREVPFEAAGGDAWQVSAPITAGTRVAVRQGGRELDGWDIVVVPDQVPGIAFHTKPSATERFSTRIEYTAADDYGITSATATIRLLTPVPDIIDRTPVVLPLPLPGAAPREAQGIGFHDLTPHPWAGLDVAIRLEATDAAGQAGYSPDQTFTLPERPFNHPVARAIIGERKKLTLGGDALREPVARALADISARPGAYGDDMAAFLALRSAVNRLTMDLEPTAIAEVQGTLWETALRIEDGGLSLAERDLRDAQSRLMEALDRDAADGEIDQLMQDLQQAMQAFLDALEERMRQAMENGQPMPQLPMDPNTQTLDRSDLERMLEQMRELSQTGSRDAARQMLSQLQQMLESLQSGQMAQQDAQQAEEMAEAMRQLQDLAKRQQELMDETFRQSQESDPGEPQSGQQGQQGQQQQGQQGQPGQQGPARQGRGPQQGGNPMQGPGGQPDQGAGEPGDAADMAARQEALRRQLGDLMRQFGERGGEIPRPLGRAERSMRDAEQALQQGTPGQAVTPQGQALDELQQGLQDMAQQMMQQMMAQPGMQPGQQPMMGRQPGRDPLGRQLPGEGMSNGEQVKIPEEADVQRAREILDELRRRAGEQNRPRQELDYIDRLLERF